MGTDKQNSNESQEIDLSYLSKKTASLFDHIGFSLFRFFKFLLKNAIVLSILIVVGAVVGYFLDKNSDDLYKSEIIVVPNFNSNSYLYNKVKNLELKNTPITSVKIEPILDIYQFIKDEWNNLEVAKYLSENNIQLNKFSPDSEVQKLYRYHLMTVVTKRKDVGGKIIDSLMNEFNKDKYFEERQKIEIENTKNLITELSNSLASVDQILGRIGTSGAASGEVSIEMYSELNNLISSRRSTILEINKNKILQLEQSKIIYPSSKMLNIKESVFPKTFVLPVVLIGLFLVFSLFKNFYEKYNKIENKRS